MKLLVFQHVPHEHPGLIAEYAKEKGISLEVVKFWESYTLPDPTIFDGLIVLGGPMGVYEEKDKFPSKEDEINYIQTVMATKPVVGFCLGSQLLAYALGAKVYPNQKDGKHLKEIGFYDVELTKQGLTDPIFKEFDSPVKVLQWHGDTFDLPKGAELLATAQDCVNQAFRYGKNTYGMLFHFEFTPEMVRKQIIEDKQWIHDGFEINEEELKKQADSNQELMRAGCYKLFDNLLSSI